MSYELLQTVKRGSPPDISFTFRYDIKRVGADVQVKVQTEIGKLSSIGYFGYYFRQKVEIGDVTTSTVTIKPSSISKWSSPIVYETGWITVPNATSLTLPLVITSISDDPDFGTKVYTYTIDVPPAASILNNIYNGIEQTCRFEADYSGGINVDITSYIPSAEHELVWDLGDGTVYNFTLPASPNSNGVYVVGGHNLNKLYSVMINCSEKVFSFKLKTFIDGDVVGESELEAVGYITCSLPQIADGKVSVFDSYSTTTYLTGNSNVLIKGYSKPRISFGSGAVTLSKNAAISKYIINGINHQTTSTGYSTVLTTCNENKFIVAAEDSRGYKAIDKEICAAGFINYKPLIVDDISIERVGGTGTDVRFNVSGSWWKHKFVCDSVSASEAQINSLTISYTCFENGESLGSTNIVVTDGLNDGKDNLVSFSVNNRYITLPNGTVFNNDKSYVIKVEISDKLSTYEKTITLSSGRPAIAISGNKVVDINLSDDAVNTVANAVLPTMFSQIFPVGAIYVSVSNVNPSTFMPGTTWISFAQGRTLVGVNSSDTNFSSVLKTGGSKYLQSHTHSATIDSDGAHSHTIGVWYDGSSSTANTVEGWRTKKSEGTMSTSSANAHTHDITINSAGTGASGNLPPYICVYMWRRTA